MNKKYKCKECGHEGTSDEFREHKVRSRDKAYFHYYYYWCKECDGKRTTKYMDKWKIKNPKRYKKNQRSGQKAYYRNNPIKVEARRLTHRAIKSGLIAKLACEYCGNFLSEIHHPNYDKPFDIRWLCKSHHIEADRGRLNLYG